MKKQILALTLLSFGMLYGCGETKPTPATNEPAKVDISIQNTTTTPAVAPADAPPAVVTTEVTPSGDTTPAVVTTEVTPSGDITPAVTVTTEVTPAAPEAVVATGTN